MYLIAIFFIVIGFGIKYAKMYFLIAGYNTMSAKEKANYDIKGIASLLGTVMFSMAALILISSLLNYLFNWPEAEGYIFFPTLFIGILFLIIRSNSKKYRIKR